MSENDPIAKLDYLTPVGEQTHRKEPFFVYFGGAILGSICSMAIALPAEWILNRIKPLPPGGDELGVAIMLILWIVFIVIVSLIASCLFRVFHGRIRHRSGRFIAIAGAINGLVGMGIFWGCGFLEDRDLLPDRVGRNFSIAMNIALPIIIGLISAQMPRTHRK